MAKIISIPYEVITEGMSFDAYFSVWEHVPLLGHYIWNSMFIATSVTILTLIAVIPAAWAFGRFDFKGRAALLTGFLTITMIGPTVFVLSFAFLWTPEMQPLPLGLTPLRHRFSRPLERSDGREPNRHFAGTGHISPFSSDISLLA